MATAPGEATNRTHPPVSLRHSRVHTKQGWNVIIKIHIENASNVAFFHLVAAAIGGTPDDGFVESLSSNKLQLPILVEVLNRPLAGIS